MKELVIEDLHKTHGTKTLLNGVNLSIQTGDRIGLIGPNGTGKSSLLKVISGKDSYDQGEMSHPNQYRIAYLDQNPQLNPNKTILETIYDSPAPLVQLVLAYQKANDKIIEQPQDEVALANFTRLSDRMNQEGGWDIEVKARTILTKLGLTDLNRPVGVCSGGEQKRIGIAQVLLNDADLLLLDEPTNHLDISSIAWLEEYLSQYKGALLIVTHDRYFLDRVSNRIIELRHGHLRQYSGNYESYLDQRAVELAHAERAMAKQDRLYQQELAWMRTGAKARTTKQQARINRFEDLKSTIDNRISADNKIELAFDQQRIGKQILSLEELSVSINHHSIINQWTKVFVKTDRLGIIGENGIGKSTLLDALAGIHPIDSGIYQVGQTVRMAYYRQLDQDLPGDMRVLAYLTQVADQFKREDGSTVSASQLLERFNFDRNMHGVTISTLSGGEKRRLYLLTLLVQEPNVLLLDEPTNDLDIDTLTVLEDYLQNFEGVVIVVSHDRYFLDKISNQILELLGGGRFRLDFGNYSDYVAQHGLAIDQKRKTNDHKKQGGQPVEKPQKAKAKRLSYFEQKEWQTIEADIMEAEGIVEHIQNQMVDHSHDAGKLMALQEKLEEYDAKVLHLYERYDYLSNIVEGGN